MTWQLAVLTLALTACAHATEPTWDNPQDDRDQDGVPALLDCDDLNGAIGRQACPRCGDDRHTGTTCNACVLPFAGAKCDQCANPRMGGAQCEQCANPGMQLPGCYQCKPGLGGSACAACANVNKAMPDCTTCLPQFGGTDCYACANPNMFPPGCVACNPDFSGPNCDQCSNPNKALPGCTACKAEFAGSICGQCANLNMALPGCTTCKPEFAGVACDACANPNMDAFGCKVCKPEFTGPGCDKCVNPHTATPGCVACKPEFACGDKGCTSTAAENCDDLDPCTDDLCDLPSDSCIHTKNAAACDDGDACTTEDTCVQGTCTGATAPECDDKNDCTVDYCNPKSGCVSQDKLFVAVQTPPYGSAEVAYAVTPAGLGFAMAGWTAAKGAGLRDFWVVRTDAEGNKLWDSTYGTGNDEIADAIVALPVGFAVAGYGSWKAGGGSPYYVYQGRLARLDADGKQLWVHTYGGSGQSQTIPNAMAALPDGFVLAGLVSTGAGTFEQRHAWLLRTDSAGEQQWEQTFPSAVLEEAHAVAVLTDGFVLSGDTGVGSYGKGSTALVIRTDALGNVIWTKSYGPIGSHANAVVALPDGFALAGSAKMTSSDNDFWLLRLDSSGNKVWETNIGGVADDQAAALVSFGTGFALAGRAASTGAGSNDFWLVRTDGLGNPEWNRTYGGADDDYGLAMALLPDGLILAGHMGALAQKTGGFGLIRTDNWGASSCLASGKCGATGIDQCDDGNKCTADSCDPKVGCKQATIPNCP